MKGPSPGSRIIALSLLSLALMFADHRMNLFVEVRSVLLSVATPFYWLTDLPNRLSDWSANNVVSRNVLQDENNALRSEALVLRAKLQKLASLATENVRLKELLNSTAIVQDNVLVAEIIGVSPDPLSHHVVVNKGSRAGVYVGQPVIDAYGLFGQIVEVGLYSCRVLLITDSTHGLPVQVNRNGVRAIVEGVGLMHELDLRHVAATTDIIEGDILFSSGLGGRFPSGYPVAKVISVIKNPGQPFSTVKARPLAQLNRSRHVLLIFKKVPQASSRAKTALLHNQETP